MSTITTSSSFVSFYSSSFLYTNNWCFNSSFTSTEYLFHLFGDPALPLPFPKVNNTLISNIPEALFIGSQTSFNANGINGYLDVFNKYIKYDKNILTLKDILEHFWLCHDPTQLNRQGPDVGRQYRSVVFYFNEKQKIIADESKKQKQLILTDIIVTEILSAKEFYLAEEYHQLYIEKRR